MCGTILSQERVSVRKPRQCDGCLVVYPKGTTMDTVTYPEMGKLWRSYQCLTCTAFVATQDHDDICDSGIRLYEYEEYADFKAKHEARQTG